jgi:hypothetical protein
MTQLEMEDGLVRVINRKIYPYSISTEAETDVKFIIKKWINDFDIETILHSIDKSADRYLVIENGRLNTDSITEFINKIGGIAYISKKGELEKKSFHVRNFVKSKFNNSDDRKCVRILLKIVKEYRQYYSDDVIILKLDEVLDFTAECKNWKQWYSYMKNIEDELTNQLPTRTPGFRQD